MPSDQRESLSIGGDRPRLLDLFCGAGGAAKGYHDAGFDVVGVDIKPQPNYPFEFFQGDALLYGIGAEQSFDAIHASPPCQAHSDLQKQNKRDYPDHIAATRGILRDSGLPYVIENVEGAPLHSPIVLCGSSFGLPIQRHRLFESNVTLMAPPCAHGQFALKYRLYRHGEWYMSRFVPVYGEGGGKAKEHWADAMGIDWMTPAELAEAIPPAYTELIGSFLLSEIERRSCLCGVSEPDYFGNRDLLEHPDCPLHGVAA